MTLSAEMMPKVKPDSSNQIEPHLRKRLADEKFPLARIADEAQVSTKALVLIKNKKKWNSELIEAKKKNNRRRLAGLAASATRLAVHFDIKPTDALEELGFDVNDRDIKSAVARATMDAKRRQLVDDPTLATIKGRAAEEDKLNGIIKVAVLNWQPFYDRDYEHSFARRYLKMLLGAIDPTWEVHEEIVNSIQVGIDGVVQEPSRYDIVFGLYALPFRRSIGLDFVTVPGLRVPLGAVVRNESNLTWERIIKTENHADFRPVVLKEEAGYHFVAGALCYPEPLPLEEHEPAKIAVELLNQIAKTGYQEVFFAADRFTCTAVVQTVDNWRSGQLIPPSLKATTIPRLKVLPDSTFDQWVPSYSAAIGLRANSHFFRSLLTESAREELFHNAALRTAALYFDLLRKPESKDLIVDVSGFDSLGKEHRHRFFQAYISVYEEKAASLNVSNDRLEDHPTTLYNAAQKILQSREQVSKEPMR